MAASGSSNASAEEPQIRLENVKNVMMQRFEQEPRESL
jgi:hypothetical protein